MKSIEARPGNQRPGKQGPGERGSGKQGPGKHKPGNTRPGAGLCLPVTHGCDLALNQAALSAVPAFHADRAAAPFHLVDRRGAELRAQCGQRPPRRIEHPHPALAVHQDGDIMAAVAAVTVGVIPGRRNIQDFSSLL